MNIVLDDMLGCGAKSPALIAIPGFRLVTRFQGSLKRDRYSTVAFDQGALTTCAYFHSTLEGETIMEKEKQTAWYVLQSKPRQEELVRENLERQAYTTYLPRILARKHRRGRWTQVVEPLFPRYLFVELTPYEDNFGPLRSTKGVSQVVRFGLEPAIAPQTVIEELRSKESPETGYIDPNKPLFNKGDQLEITDGPFQGLVGIFEAKTGEERVILMLNMLGNQTRVTVPSNQVMPLSA